MMNNDNGGNQPQPQDSQNPPSGQAQEPAGVPSTSQGDIKRRGRQPKLAAIAAALSLDEEVHFQTVRDLARHDPPMGCPMRWEHAGEEINVEPGAWMDHGFIVDLETQLPVNIPVQALGVDSNFAYFLNTLGQVVALKGSSGKGDFELLFAGRNDYLTWLFPRYSKTGAIAGWEADMLKQALFKWAGWCGTYDDTDNVRGRGMWRDPKGHAVFHAGNAIFIDGEWKKPGRFGKYIYPARPEVGRPRRHPDISQDVGQRVLDILKTWTWSRPDVDPVLQLGWIMTAKMGATLHRRPVLWITGPRGCGKSYLQVFLRALMHEAMIASSNITPAGIYQKLGSDCIPVLLDEQESKDNPAVMDRLLDIIRVAYTGDELNRGDKDGKSKTFRLRSSFLASSIAKPAMESSDDSRMALLNMKKRESIDGAAYTEGEAYRMGQALTRRVIDWFPRWDGLLAQVETALATHKGHGSRSLDTFAPLIAGYHIALFDDMPDEAQLKAYGALLNPEGLIELKVQMDDWEKCMRHLLSAMPEVMKHKSRKNIGAVLESFMKIKVQEANGAEFDVDEALSGFRVSVTWRRGDIPTKDKALLFIPNMDPALVDLFSGTGWAGKKGSAGAWNGVMKQAPEHLWEDYSSSKGGVGSVRGVAFKLQALMRHLTGDSDDDGDEPPARPEPAPKLDLGGGTAGGKVVDRAPVKTRLEPGGARYLTRDELAAMTDEEIEAMSREGDGFE